MFSRVEHGEVQRALLKEDRLLREQEVSEMLGVAIATLQAWRRVGKPPAFIRLGRAVRYRLSDLHQLIRGAATPTGQGTARMPPRRAKAIGLPAVNSPVLFDYSEQLAILLFGQLMKWLRPMVRRGDSIPLADLRDALWAVKEAWELHRDIARACGPQTLTAVPAEELDALTAGYDPLIDARELSVADKRRLQAHLAQQREVAETEDQQQPPPPEVILAAEHDALIEQLRVLARHPWEVMQERWRDGCLQTSRQRGALAPRQLG